jgi:glutathione reductase (NADPH)
MTHFDYDLFVIGAGSGGVRAARLAAQQYGKRVAIAEEFRVGGTCVIRGCVPKKLLVYASHYSEAIEDAAGYGWTIGGASFDWQRLIAEKDAEIDRLSRIYTANLEKAGVTLLRERAVLEDAHTMRLMGSSRTVTADTILIATGARPSAPDVPGKELLITSNEALDLPALPRSVAILGSGYIALEFAGIFHGLGAQVSVVYRGPQILRGFDDDVRNALQHALTAKGIKIHLNAQLEAIEGGRNMKVRLRDGLTIEAEAVMAATGRVPHTDGLGLNNAGVVLGRNGAVAVDNFSRTSVDNIYAIGDVTDRANLTPVAIRDAIAFTATVYAGNPTPVDHACIPTAVFSQPEIGTVGLTEAEARAQFSAVDIYKTTFRPMQYVLPQREERMLMKLVVDAVSGRVLGCHILGPAAAEMAQILAIPLRMGATKADFDAAMALHPTTAEELVTLREKWVP